MSTSYTITEATTFTLTHAKYISSKVAADLKRIQRLYPNKLTDTEIANYETEMTELLKAGYLREVRYGFQRKVGEKKEWIQPTLIYAAQDLAGSYWDDDDPGRIEAGANIDGAYFTSYLTYTHAWDLLTPAQQTAFKNSLPFQRVGMAQPTINGYITNDKSYSAGGRALNRSSVRSF